MITSKEQQEVRRQARIARAEGEYVLRGHHEASVVAAIINDLSDEIGIWAKGHGFQVDWEAANQLDDLAQRLHDEDVDGNQADYMMLWHAAEVVRNNVLGTKLMLIVTECAEAMETLRNNGAEGVLNNEGNFDEELGDIVIRVLHLADMIKSPIGDEIMRKVGVNKERPYKHGRKL